MAITTLDGAAAGARPPQMFAKAVSGTLVAGRPHSYWSAAGSPGAGSFDTTLAGVALSSTSALVNGQIPRWNPASGNAYLHRLTARATQPGVLMLLDRLWHNGGITITSNTAQTVNSATLPSRCPTSGTDDTPSTNGHGVLAALEVSANVGAGTPTLTLSYTNSAGTSGRTATNILATAASPIVGATYFFGLQAGDAGIRSIQTYTQSATWTSGTVNLSMFRILAELEVTAAHVGSAIDFLTGGAPRLYDGTVPWLVFVPNTTTATNVSGTYVETHG